MTGFLKPAFPSLFCRLLPAILRLRRTSLTAIWQPATKRGRNVLTLFFTATSAADSV